MVTFRTLDIPKDWHWVASRARPSIVSDTRGIVAVSEQGVILAAAIFDSWTKTSCCIHLAIDSPIVIKHGFCNEICDYVFNQAGRLMLIGMTPSDNARALKFIFHVGMHEIFRIKDGFDVGIDYVITQMLKKECRWING